MAATPHLQTEAERQSMADEAASITAPATRESYRREALKTLELMDSVTAATRARRQIAEANARTDAVEARRRELAA